MTKNRSEHNVAEHEKAKDKLEDLRLNFDLFNSTKELCGTLTCPQIEAHVLSKEE